MNEFKKGDEVIIEAFVSDESYESYGLIGGIFNHMTEDGLSDMFNLKELYENGFEDKISKCWNDVLKGTIVSIGRYNSYIIQANNKKFYVFVNNYNEMRLND